MVRGQVTFVGANYLVADETGAVWVTPAASEAGKPPEVGAAVEIAGFADPGPASPRLLDARVLKRAPAPAPVARPLDPDSLFGHGQDDQLVSIRGEVTDVVSAPAAAITLSTALGPVLGLAPQEARWAFPAAAARGAEVEVWGIKRSSRLSANPTLLLRSPDDLKVLAGPSLWSPRLAAILISLLGAISVALLWRTLTLRAARQELEDRVHERTAELQARARALELQGRELSEIQHLHARLFATMVHDVRSPLQGVSLSADLLRRAATPADREQLAQGIVEDIEHINRELTTLVRRYREERFTLRLEAFDLANAVRAGCALAARLLEAKHQRLKLEVADGPVPAIGDPDILTHVVLNLVSNASKFSAAHTEIEVRVSASPARVAVRDQGVGLEESDRMLLFKEGARPSVKPTAGEPSLGDGLILCARWVEAMGGTIECRSAKAQGSTFTVMLKS